MDELDKQIYEALDHYQVGHTQDNPNAAEESLGMIKQALKDAGYIHIPTSKGKNVTIYTSDNDEPLLTESEWREKFNA